MGTSQQKVFNRWFVVIGAILIQLCLGAIYAWSVFTSELVLKSPAQAEEALLSHSAVSEVAIGERPSDKKSDNARAKNLFAQVVSKEGNEPNDTLASELKKYVKTKLGADQVKEVKFVESLSEVSISNIKTFGFSKTQTQIIFSVGLAVFALVMVLAGRWQAKSGPRIVAIVGGILLGAGYILAGLFGTNFISQVIFIGIIAGAGIGFAYVCPISVGMKWFPDKKGLITGLAVAGFGFGALIWVKLAGNWGDLLDNIGVMKTFLLYGIIFAVSVLIGSIWMVNPPEGWKPAGWVPQAAQAKKKTSIVSSKDFLPAEMLRRSQFYSIWIMFIFSSMAGLMTIGIIKLFGIDALTKSGMDSIQAGAVAGTAMAVFYSIANGIGRIIWGIVSDKIGRKVSLVLMCIFQGIMMLIFFWMGSVKYLLYLGAAVIGFNFGGNFALFPTVTADLFGTKNVGRNYGWVFTAYGVGGIIGPIMAGVISDVWKNWLAAFIICGVACLIAAIIGLTLKPPKAETA